MDRQPIRRRFWIEAGLGSLTGISSILTVLWHDWIEIVFRIEPDAHSGTFEVALSVALAIATVAVGALASHEWRSSRLGELR